MLTREIHSNINLNWLEENGFIKFIENQPMTTKYLDYSTRPNMQQVFIGQHNSLKQPDGFVRIIDQQGNIYEGNFGPNLKFNGWSISYIGTSNTIYAGWYKNNKRHGNWMSLNARESKVKEQGWYQENQR